jgi:hypothetical protein
MKEERRIVETPNHTTGHCACLFKVRRLSTSLAVMVVATGITFMVMLPRGSAPVLAQEVINAEEPTPSSVYEVTTPMGRSFKEKPSLPGLFLRAKEELKNTDPFFRDTKLGVNLRTYYFYEDNYPNTTPQFNEAWAIGGSLSYQSGWFLNHLALGAALYTSQPLHAPHDRDGTLLLQPVQEGYTVLGQSYGRIKLFEDNFINIYRYEYNTPFINQHDNLMTPNTFEGYTFQGASGGKDGAPGFRYGGGYITKIKERSSEDFVWMSKAAGAPVDKGVALAGANFSLGRLFIGAFEYYCDGVINIGYAEANYTLPLTQKLGLLLAAQFTDQRSVGEDLPTGSSFSVNQLGVKGAISYGGAVFTLGYTTDSSGADLHSPWSGYPGYTSVLVKNFNRAGEKALLVKASYDFTGLGLEGVTAEALLVHGWDRIIPSTGKWLPNENELDLDLQWKPKTGFFQNFWPRVRYGVVHQYEGQERYIHNLRIIVNYPISFL